MANARALLTEELQHLVRDAVADVSSEAGALEQDRRPRRRSARSPVAERRRTPQATILQLPPPGEPPELPLTDAAGSAAVREPPGSPAPHQRAFLARVEVASSVPTVRHPVRTRRVAVACRRASPLDARRATRMLRVAVPGMVLGSPAAASGPPAWVVTALAPSAAPAPPRPAPGPMAPAPPLPATIRRVPGGGAEILGRPVLPPLAAPPPIAPPPAPQPRPLPPIPAAPPAPSPPAAAPIAAPEVAASPAAQPAPARQDEEAPTPRWRAAGGHVVNLLIAAALEVVVIMCALVVGLVVTGHHIEQVVTGSMQPVIPIQSLVITERVPVSQLQVGDILVFPNPNNGNETIVHRIVWTGHDKQGNLLVRTKGDANQLADNWTISRSMAAYTDIVHWIVPGGGTLASDLQKAGVGGLILLVIGIIGWYGLRKVRKILSEDGEKPGGTAEGAA